MQEHEDFINHLRKWASSPVMAEREAPSGSLQQFLKRRTTRLAYFACFGLIGQFEGYQEYSLDPLDGGRGYPTWAPGRELQPVFFLGKPELGSG